MGLKSERVFWKHIYREIHCAFYNRIVLNVGLNLLLKALVSLAEALDEWYVFLIDGATSIKRHKRDLKQNGTQDK